MLRADQRHIREEGDTTYSYSFVKKFGPFFDSVRFFFRGVPLVIGEPTIRGEGTTATGGQRLSFDGSRSLDEAVEVILPDAGEANWKLCVGVACAVPEEVEDVYANDPV